MYTNFDQSSPWTLVSAMFLFKTGANSLSDHVVITLQRFCQERRKVGKKERKKEEKEFCVFDVELLLCSGDTFASISNQNGIGKAEEYLVRLWKSKMSLLARAIHISYVI